MARLRCAVAFAAVPTFAALVARLLDWSRQEVLPLRVCVSTTVGDGTLGPVGVPPARPYHWPDAHGPHGGLSGSSRSLVAPLDLRGSLAWRWHHPQGRFYTILNGVAIDDEQSVYLTEDNALRKFSPDGALLWTHCILSTIPSAPSLLDGTVYFSAVDGIIHAVSMSSGRERWARRIGSTIGCDTDIVVAHDGLVLAAAETVETEAGGRGGGQFVKALNAGDGSLAWEFKTDRAVWNFYAVFPGDGTFLFQDLEGKTYRNRLSDGTVIWKSGGAPGTWNDGSISLGPDGMVYSVVSLGRNLPGEPGSVIAYRISDGELLWRTAMPEPPNQFPAVGRLGAGPGLSLVVAIGVYQPTAIYALDAKTGEVQWMWPGPPMGFQGAAGDSVGSYIRSTLGNYRTMCMPNAWSNPSIDANGTVFIGHNGGMFAAIKDSNGDGRIEDAEVSRFSTAAGLPGSGPALAPGTVAVASCDTLHVFRA